MQVLGSYTDYLKPFSWHVILNVLTLDFKICFVCKNLVGIWNTGSKYFGCIKPFTWLDVLLRSSTVVWFQVGKLDQISPPEFSSDLSPVQYWSCRIKGTAQHCKTPPSVAGDQSLALCLCPWGTESTAVEEE